MQLRFIGAAGGEVTGSCTLIELENGKKVLVDCGMHHGKRNNGEHNHSFPPEDVRAEEIEAVILTHAHADHVGLLPRLYRLGFRGRVLGTEATMELCSVSFPDAARIHKREIEYRLKKGGVSLDLLFTDKDAEGCVDLFVRGIKYGELIDVCEGMQARFFDAGHVLGSAFVEISTDEGKGRQTKGIFSGDLGRDTLLSKAPEPLIGADYLVIEGVYGDRLHDEPDFMVACRRLAQTALDRCVRQRGTLIIPAFSLDRTQKIIEAFRQLMKEPEYAALKDIPFYLDSPIAAKTTEVYKKEECVRYLSENIRDLSERGEDIFNLPNLEVIQTQERSKEIAKSKIARVVIAASGNMQHGSVVRHLYHNIENPNCTIAVVGYQPKGTIGDAVKNCLPVIRIERENKVVRAEIVNIDGFSAHADQKELLRFIEQVADNSVERVKSWLHQDITVFVNHSETEAQRRLVEEAGKIKGVKAYEALKNAEYRIFGRKVVRLKEGERVYQHMNVAQQQKVIEEAETLRMGRKFGLPDVKRGAKYYLDKVKRAVRDGQTDARGVGKSLSKFVGEVERLKKVLEKDGRISVNGSNGQHPGHDNEDMRSKFAKLWSVRAQSIQQRAARAEREYLAVMKAFSSMPAGVLCKYSEELRRLNRVLDESARILLGHALKDIRRKDDAIPVCAPKKEDRQVPVRAL